MIIVANVKWGQPGIYIGRAVLSGIHDGQPVLRRPASPLANPWPISQHCTRAQAIAAYKVWLTERIAAGDEAIMEELKRIKDLSRVGDVRLNCWCRPRPCHGQVIKEILEAME